MRWISSLMRRWVSRNCACTLATRGWRGPYLLDRSASFLAISAYWARSLLTISEVIAALKPPASPPDFFSCWTWSNLARASAVWTRAATSWLLRSVICWSFTVTPCDTVRLLAERKSSTAFSAAPTRDFSPSIWPLSHVEAIRLASFLARTCSSKYASATALAIAAAFRGDSELTLMSTRKVVPCRLTFIRRCRMSTDLALAASSRLAPPAGPPLLNRLNNRLTGSRRPGVGMNSGSAVNFSFSTTRCRIAPDWINSVSLSMVASSVPKFDICSADWFDSIALERRGSTSTVEVAVYNVVADSAQSSASVISASGGAATIFQRRRRMRASSRRSTVGCDPRSSAPAVCSSNVSAGCSKLRCNIDSYLVFVEAEGGDIAVAGGVSMEDGNGAKSIEQILDTGIGGGDVVLALLAEEAVALISAGERHNDIAAQLVVQSELQGVGEHAGGTGIGSFGDELLGLEVNIQQAGGAPGQFGAIGGTGDGADGRIDEALLHIAGAQFARDQVVPSERDPAQCAIALRIQRLARGAADIALVAFDAAEPAKHRRERIIDPAVKRIDLTIQAILIDHGAVLRPRRSVIVGIGAKADRGGQPIEFLANADIAGQEIIRRRLHRAGRRTQGTDTDIQMGDLEIGENLHIVGDIDPAIALEAGIGLIEAGIAMISGLLGIQRHVDAMLVPERARAQRGLDHRGDVRALQGVRGKHVAVVEPAGNQRRTEHPGAGADSDRLITGLLSIFHRRVLGWHLFAAVRVRQVRQR